jgi:hypothetical protein
MLTDGGVNLVGYLTRESSLGDVARRVAQALTDADVAVAPLAYQRTASPHVDSTRAAPGVIAHRHTLAVVNADQFPALAADHPELFLAATHRIGYWFWELEHVPADACGGITGRRDLGRIPLRRRRLPRGRRHTGAPCRCHSHDRWRRHAPEPRSNSSLRWVTGSCSPSSSTTSA